MESKKQEAQIIPFKRPIKVEASTHLSVTQAYQKRLAIAAYEAAARASYLLYPRIRAAKVRAANSLAAAAAAGAAI